MQKEITIVPKDKCPLDVLAEMGERTRKAWIFLHANAISKLESDADCVMELFHDTQQFTWNATEKYPETTIITGTLAGISSGTWCKVYRIYAEDIAFALIPDDPDEILFLKMAE